MRYLALLFALSWGVNLSYGQLDISVSGSPTLIDFDNSISGVNNGAFQGDGFEQTPAVGRLDSDAWEVLGLSQGDLLFGGTEITAGDFARGTSPGGVGTGGIYGFNLGTSGQGLGFQPAGSDLTPGSITLRVQNNISGQNITSMIISYEIYEFNDQNRSNSLNFEYSSDNVTYIQQPAANFATTETASGSPSWQSVSRVVNLSGLNIPETQFLYLKWTTDDLTGSGSRDEIAIDNIEITATAGTPIPNISIPTNASVGEALGSIDIPISIDSAPSSDIVLDLTLNDISANLTTDYNNPASVQVTFPMGSTTDQIVTIPIVDDAVLEPTEDFEFEIAVNSGMANITNASTIITIEDDDLVCTVSPGDLVITEIMYNPDVVGDSVGEWIEIHNPTGVAIDLLGFTLEDNADTHDINQSVVVPAGGYVILGRNNDIAVNGGVSVNYVFEQIFLSNSGDQVRISCGATLIDEVVYDLTNFPDASASGSPGNAILLDFATYNATANDLGENWCFSSSPFGDGDFGTPGIENPLCTPIYDDINSACEDAGSTPITSTGSATWQDILSSDGRIIASINDQGETLGTITTELYITNIAREDNDGTNYMNRSVYIDVQTQPTAANEPLVRLYFTDAELQQLITDAGADADAPVDVFSIVITKLNNVACSPTFSGAAGDATFITPVANTYGNDYFIEFPVTSFSGFFMHGGALILPVEFGNVGARLANNDALISWNTLSEQGNAQFEVEHAFDGGLFQAIGTRQAQSNAENGAAYQFVHENPQPGTHYYRIKQIDQNGRSAYSKIVQLIVSSDKQVFYSLRDKAIFAPEGMLIKAFNVKGILIGEFENETTISTSGWTPGIYFIQYEGKVLKVAVF